MAAPLLPVSLFWRGWSDYRSVSIWSGLRACVIFSAVLIAICVSSYEYVIDNCGDYAAIALSSITKVPMLPRRRGYSHSGDVHV